MKQMWNVPVECAHMISHTITRSITDARDEIPSCLGCTKVNPNCTHRKSRIFYLFILEKIKVLIAQFGPEDRSFSL